MSDPMRNTTMAIVLALLLMAAAVVVSLVS